MVRIEKGSKHYVLAEIHLLYHIDRGEGRGGG